MLKNIFKRIIAACAAVCILLPTTVAFGEPEYDNIDSHKLSERYQTFSKDIDEENSAPYYISYKESLDKNGIKDAGSDISVDIKTGTDKDGNLIDFVDGGFAWDNEKIPSVTWSFDVEEAGYYNITFTYTSIEKGSDSARRSIKIDGEVPYAELNNIDFDRIWKDDGEPWTNAEGNQVRPKQVQVFEKRTFAASDALGRYNEPLKIYLTQGTHTITLGASSEPVCIHAISFTAPKTYKDYAEVLKEYKDKGYKNAESQIKIDAEDALEKNGISLRLETSSDPLADPTAIDGIVFNAIGGTNWSEGNKSITWKFVAEEDGLYKLNLRVYQKYNDGLSSYRQIAIDGQVPYKEFLCMEFKQSSWKDTVLENENKEPYLVYLSKGEHTLTMSVKTSPYLNVLLELETGLDILSGVVQDVIKITGIDPDINFDYKIDKQIPDIMDRFSKISECLDIQINLLTKMANKKTSTVSGLKQIKYRVDKIIADPFLIGKYFTTLIGDQETLSSWISGFNNLALMLDYMTFENPDQKISSKKANILDFLYYHTKQFIRSFTNDYSSVNSGDSDENKKEIKVWVSRGKEWAQILDQLIDDDYSKNTGVNVDLNMLPAGQLGISGVILLAIASGTAPDVVLGTDYTTPVEYGMRDAVVDLAQFSDFEEVSSMFIDGTMNSYTFKDKAFGLPETIDFTVMYYRTDIMNSLGLDIPDNWDELYSTVLPELKRNGMDFWYEGSLYTFLFQNGGTLYSEDGLKSALDSAEGNEAFRQFTDLYRVYGVPVLANFYNRFRSGQMPIGISSFATYLQLTAAAPELEGKWKVSAIPGTIREDGTLDRTTFANLTSVMLIDNKDEQVKNLSWDFTKWYLSASTQKRYANDLMAGIGASAKWFSANTEAFDSLSWDTNLQTTVKEQREWITGLPNVVGGYITARHIENARVRTIINGMNYRESIERAAEDITNELIFKNEEFILRDSQKK